MRKSSKQQQNKVAPCVIKTKPKGQIKVKANVNKPTKKLTETQKIKLEIKQKQKKLKELEQEKLKLQEQRQEIYKNTSDPEKYYVTNKDLLEELLLWKDSNKDEEERRTKLGLPIIYEDRKISEKLGRMFMAIAYKLTNHSFFRNYSKEIKEDCISYAMEKCVTGIKNFNFNFKNPFAYFSQSCFNSFRTTLSKHYKQINIKRSYMKKIMTDIESNMPNSGMKKCLDNRFANDDYYNCEG